MLPLVLQSAEGVEGVNAIEFRLTIDRLPDGRTWTYQPTAWRLPNGMWMKIVNGKPVTITEIKAIETQTGWKMEMLGKKIDTFDWVYTFQKAS